MMAVDWFCCPVSWAITLPLSSRPNVNLSIESVSPGSTSSGGRRRLRGLDDHLGKRGLCATLHGKSLDGRLLLTRLTGVLGVGYRIACSTRGALFSVRSSDEDGRRWAGNQTDDLFQTRSKRREIRAGGGNVRANASQPSVSNESAGSGFIRSKLAVFLSGGGSNFRALHSATLNKSIYGDVVVVISDKPGCKGCHYAREQGLPVLTFPRSKLAEDGLSADELVAALRERGIDYILLAGYLKLLPQELVKAYPRSILNVHPSLLPSFGGKGFYGMKVHEAVIKSGARFSGATIHFVDEKFDTGPIVAQRVVPILSYDTSHDLAAKVLAVEHLLYSEVVAALCEDRIFWREDGVPLIRKSWTEAHYY